MNAEQRHDLTLWSPAYAGTRASGPLSSHGYRADDPPEEAQWKCACGWIGAESELKEGECPNKEVDRDK